MTRASQADLSLAAEPAEFATVFVLGSSSQDLLSFAKACRTLRTRTVDCRSGVAAGIVRRDAIEGDRAGIDEGPISIRGLPEQSFSGTALFVRLQPAAPVGGSDPAAGKRVSPTAIEEDVERFVARPDHAIMIDMARPEAGFRQLAAAIGADEHLDAALLELAKNLAQARGGGEDLPNGDPASEAIGSFETQDRQIRRLRAELAGSSAELKRTRQALKTAEASALLAAGRRAEEVRKLRTRLKWSMALALPGMIALSPILLPGAAIYRIFRKRGSKRSGLFGLRRKSGSAKSPGSKANNIVVEAFELFHSQGVQAALALLERHRDATRPEMRDLFRSMAASGDAQWLGHFNAWLKHRGLSQLFLTPGQGPRFHRLAFEPAKPVDAPCRVTVIVPCHNAQDMVENAVRSILAQTWRDLEVIAVNDASDDDTGEILERLAREDSRLVVLHNKVNVGPYVSRNRALLQASGDYVTGHDADDLASPTRIADQMAPILAEPGCKATLGHMIRLDEDGHLAYPTRWKSISYDGIVRIAFVSLLVERSLLFEKLGYWNCVRFGADSEMIERVRDYLGQDLRTIDDVLMLCLSASGSLTNDPATGIGPMTGLSPVRVAYREAWMKWHNATRPDDRFMAFPPGSGPFDAPKEMRVPEADIRLVLGVDRV